MGVLTQLREAHDDKLVSARRVFFELGESPEAGLALPILRSWERCRTAGLDFRDHHALDPVGRVQLAEARERSGFVRECHTWNSSVPFCASQSRVGRLLHSR